MKYLLTQEQYDTFKREWARKSDAKALTAADMLFFNLVHGRDPKKGFQPCNSGRQRGNDPWFAFNQARIAVRMWKILSSNTWYKILNITKEQDAVLLEATKNG